MNGTDSPKLTASDETLVTQTRAGDHRAFAELWRRHYRSGARVARQFTASLDAEDLVSEAYTRIYQRVLAGGGPTGAFRPYLYTTIRNLASSWGAALREISVDDIAEFEDPSTSGDPTVLALDKTLTARAFRSLPERWQSVLWYTEVEGMDPHEVAPLLGMSPNGVAALSYRAREGLRKAWLQAHINDASSSGECQWAISRIGENSRHSLSPRDSERIEFHLATCSKCTIISEEVGEVGSRLAMVMIPILLGGGVGGAFLASTGGGAGAAVAAVAIPAAPVIAGVGGVASGFGAAAAPVAFISTLVIAVAIGGAVVLVGPTASSPQTSQASNPRSFDASAQGDVTAAGGFDQASTPIDSLGLGSPGIDRLGAGQLVGVVDPLAGTIAPVVTADIALSGHGAPGATVTAKAAGVVYATTTIAADGSFSLVVKGMPRGTSGLQLSQALGGLLGALVLAVPLSLDGAVLATAVTLIN